MGRSRDGMMTFSELGLSGDVVRSVVDAGYQTPTPIQAQAIPSVLAGRDVLGCAQTGTGKTAGFTLPMIDILASGRAKAKMPRSLILEPTRELAAQVAESFEKYGKYNKLTMALLIGGVSYADQEKLLDRGVDVLIATPGRLIDHYERGRILLMDVKVLVIDEADRMLDMGFIPDIEKIVRWLPQRRQTLFFSATMPPEIRRLADAFLTDPKEISVAPPASTATTVAQHLSVVDDDDKREALRRLIRAEDIKNAIVFCNRKKDVGILHRSLVSHGFNAAAIHGDLPQSVRTETLERFKRDEITLLIASDVAARGLDIVDLSHVFNFDVPIHAEDYVHRIGRTGRAGKTGRAFTLATPEDGRAVSAIETLIGKAIPRFDIAGVDTQEFLPDDGKRRRRGKGKPEKERPTREQPAKPEGERPARAAENRRPRPEPEAERPAREPATAELTPFDRDNRRGRDRDRDRDRDRRRHRYEEDDQPVVGLGDHVPAFLLRPVKIAKAS